MQNNTGKILVVAIDFGTTFSGYAFSFRHEFEKDPLKICSSQWIGGSRAAISLKTSSCVLFHPSGEFDSFGFDAEEKYNDLAMDDLHHDWFFFRRFKMLLYNTEVSIITANDEDLDIIIIIITMTMTTTTMMMVMLNRFNVLWTQ